MFAIMKHVEQILTKNPLSVPVMVLVLGSAPGLGLDLGLRLVPGADPGPVLAMAPVLVLVGWQW